MLALSGKQKTIIGSILLLFMVLTRTHLVDHVQDASWAVLFLAGFYLRSWLVYPLFWLAGFAVDYTVTSADLVSSYCFTPAYTFTLVAYASLWAAGSWFATHYSYDMKGALKLSGALISGILVCFFLTNSSFYALAGYFAQMSAADYTVAVMKYLPSYLLMTSFYVGIAVLVHSAVLTKMVQLQRTA